MSFMDVDTFLMNWSRLRSSGNEHVFKGSQLVTSILERHPKHFRSRATALKFCRQLFNDGILKGVFGADTFEDSVQLYTWKDQNGTSMTSYPVNQSKKNYGYSSADITLTKRDLYKQKETIKPVGGSRDKIQTHNPYAHDVNDYFKDIQNGICADDNHPVTKHLQHPHMSSYQTTWNLQRASTASSESSIDILSHSYGKHKDKTLKSSFSIPIMSHSRDHDVIPEESPEEHVPVMERTGTSTEYDGSSSIPRSVTTDASGFNEMEGAAHHRRWQQDYQNSYSDNEKQLIEQMKRMKKEHSHILRTYEDRINKLMAKMHELRSIAEMLENSSTKSSPYGMMANKTGVLSFLNAKADADRKLSSAITGNDVDNPPPLPPRPGRGNRLNPNKPIIQTDAKMKPFPWTRIILRDDSTDEQTTIWHTMMEPKLDPEEIERLFSTQVVSQTDGATLYDDLIIRRGRSRQQLVSVYDTERSKRIVVCMKCLRATLNDVVASVSSLDTSQINHEGLAELMELLSPTSDIDKILYHVRKKGAGHLDHPEYLVFELSKVDHFKDRLEFIRFRFKLLWHLFEIDQQLRELHTACDEISNSTSLKNLLETLLAVGNYLNGATEMGQADGFGIEVLNKMKEIQDRDCKGTLLEFVLKTYCQIYESEVDIGCPTRFRLPEPSNMRHASQVSFEGIQDALTNLHSDLRHIREKLLDPRLNKDVMRPMDSFRVSAENFFASALEVIGEQEKVLQDTRDVFDKTTTFFFVDNKHITPQQFFQIWAVFLHDCKYFWKLAHRRLAKERFELEFKYKGQVSANSLQGYGSFRAGVLKGVDSLNNADPKTSTAQRRGNRLNENQDPSKPNVPPKPSRSINTDTADQSDRSSSPKPLTSSPPSSVDVYKPMPKAPVQNNHVVSNGPSNYAPNYENQSELDRLQQQQHYHHHHHHHHHQQQQHYYQQPTQDAYTNNTSVPVSETSPGSTYYRSPNSSNTKDKKSSQQFSLKTWLKREREQVRKEVESDTVDVTSIPESKPNSSTKSFSRFKNSMIQKFSGSSSNKKQDNSSKKSKENKGVSVTSPVANKHAAHHNAVPYDIIRNNYSATDQNKYNPSRETGALNLDSLEEYNKPLPDTVISPIDDPECEEPVITKQHDYGHQNMRPQHTINGEHVVHNGDVNNNDKYGDNKFQHTSGWTQSKSSENPYGRLHKDNYVESHKRESAFARGPGDHGVESKRVVAQTVPLYKARIINNYENQGKFENPHAVRQQAEAVKPMSVNNLHENNNGTVTFENRTEDQKSPYAGYDVEHTRNKSLDNTHVDGAHANKHFSHTQSNKDNSPYGHHGKLNKGTDVVRSPQDTPRKRTVLENRNYFTPGNRAPMNVQSIGSLIDKFDKYNNNTTDGQTTHQTANQNASSSSNPAAMTSTPRKVSPNGESSDMSPPLPPRMSLSPSKSRTQNTEQADYRNSSSHLSADRQAYTSPQSRLDNLTSTNLSPPSVYSTPQGEPVHSASNWSQHNNTNHFYTPTSSNASRSRSFYTSPQTRANLDREPRDIDNSRGNLTNGNHFTNGYHNSHVATADQSEDRDDGYRAMLRKAATQSSYDRQSKNTPQYTGRPSFGSPYSETNTTPYSSSSVVKSPVLNNDEVAYMAF
ncbi:formin-J-like isoform X3 [Ruditapes philippinarum]|uniref:formin-J-like isoform X3 n=1 Tax=Ruditapes philippinarum TaxID=129788 RepID=UPI00295B1438|nr:formin-J-like isoform X3 [Ruditapes philippinarum]